MKCVLVRSTCHCMYVVMVVCTLAQISDDVIVAENWVVLVHTSTMDRPPTEKVR